MKYINRPKEDLWLLREKYRGKECPEFLEDLKRIADGEPIDYVIGFTNFLGAKIDLSARPMIPRAETEFWVEKAISLTLGHPMSQYKILDLFAGSGCIGIAVMEKIPNAAVDFGEMDPNLVEQIKKNIAGNEINRENAHVYETDIFKNIPETKYDVIFANPPYISQDRKGQVARPVLEHEPHLALFAEEEGLFFVKKLLDESPSHLAPGGIMFIEFDTWQKEEIEKLAADSHFTAEFWKDQYDKWRVVMLTLQ